MVHKQLFEVHTVKNGKEKSTGMTFEKKQDAKALRDAIIGKGEIAVVHRGPDHRHGPSQETKQCEN